jgi:AAA+ ATPase superfamily predicted ATPase
MSGSPFSYGRTVSSAAFTDREEELSRLKSNLLNGINTVLMAPRRWGKSSLVEKAVYDIRRKEKNTKTIIIDLFSAGNAHEFLELFSREVIRASTPRWQEWLSTAGDFFKTIIPKISVGIDPQSDFTLSFDRKELEKHSDEILNLPEVIAKKRKIRFIICLDEFQQLASYTGFSSLEKKMRAAWQRHKSVTYCLYGSRRHMMEELFNNSTRPFYRFGDVMSLGKIPEKKWITFIVKGFTSTGKNISAEDASLIAQLMKNHSWYVQQLAHYTWNLTRKKAGRKEIRKAMEELILANSPLYQKETENLSATQISLIKAILQGETKLTSGDVMQKYFLGTPNNVSKNKTALLHADLINESAGRYELLDPAYELWLREMYLNEPYPLQDTK